MRFLVKVFVLAVAFILAAPTYAADARQSRSDRVAAILAAKRVPVRVAGMLTFCNKDGLRQAVTREAGREVVREQIEAKEQDAFETSVEVVQAIDTYANGVAMGLELAHVTPSQKAEICAKTLELTDKIMAHDDPATKP